MSFYRLGAEQIRNKQEMLVKLQQLTEVCFAAEHAVFNSFYTVVVKCDKATADRVRDLMWRYNGGAYCSLDEITGDQLDDMM